MVDIISAVDPALIAEELKEMAPMRVFKGLELYSFKAHECPNCMREIGRLRETAFRVVGAGRNVECDVDELDTSPDGYRQIVAWDPRHAQIVAMYRYQMGCAVYQAGDHVLRTSQLFEYAPYFRSEMLPYAIELGRSVVNQAATRRILGLFAVWTGLGALLQRHPEVEYFFGNVSLYRNLNPRALDFLIGFLETVYAPQVSLLIARPGLRWEPDADPVLHSPLGSTPGQRIAYLKKELDSYNERIPPILQSYMGLSNRLWFGQTACDADFGDAMEIGIVVPVKSVDPEIKAKFIDVV